MPSSIPFEVADRIGRYYVYVLIDPRDGEIFYVGKGTGDRIAAHGKAAGLEAEPGQTAKTARIHAIRGAGLEPTIDIFRHGITTEEEASRIEAALIECLPGLTNLAGGHDTDTGRTSLDELVSRYGALPRADQNSPSNLPRRCEVIPSCPVRFPGSPSTTSTSTPSSQQQCLQPGLLGS